MKVLLISQEAPLDDSTVVTGNAVRCRQLCNSLAAAGHAVTQVWQQTGEARQPGTFDGRDALRSLVIRHQPDALVVCWWELVKLLPFDLEQPVVLDFVAPRPLEQLYENPEGLARELRQLRLVLQKCDLLLVGNQWQKHLMVMPLLEAGFDLRKDLPVCVLPLSGPALDPPQSDPVKTGWTLVSGGISWPWRRSASYWRAINRFNEQQSGARLVLFGGQYPLHEHYSDAELDFEFTGLLPYREFSDFLTQQAHIGLELADHNIERAYSQSFRSVEFLRRGLPLICNRYLPIARQIEQYDAGWLLDGPDELPRLLGRIYGDPDGWRRKSEQALALAREALDPDRNAAPLLEWLDQAGKAPRLPEEIPEAEPQLGTPPLAQRLKIQSRLAVRAVRARLFGKQQGSGIVIVTRGDLFPTDHGAAVKIVETARGLASHGRRVAIVTDDRARWWELRDGALEPRPIPGWLRLLSLPGSLSKLLHFSKDLPQSNAFLYLPLSDGSFFWRTLYVARRIGAGILQAEFPAYARPCLKVRHFLGTRTVLVEHNVEYARLRAQLGELTEAQYQRFKAIELDLCNRVNAVVCVSDNDRQRLAEDGVDPARLHTIPHGVDLRAFDEAQPAGARQRFGIPAEALLLVFHGTFSYPPNSQALGVFAEDLLPRLERAGLEAHLLAIGRDPPPDSPHPRIHLTGSVEDLAGWLKAADLAVIPLLEGGGTRMKIIDCFAARLPVLSTAKGIEGIPVENGRDALVIDDWDELAQAIVKLAHNPEQASELAENGYVMARKLDWHVIARRYLDLYRRI
jgi:glycosyltransferase involved in cell wall biosynthesis